MPVTKLAMPKSHLTYGEQSSLTYPEFLRRKVARFMGRDYDREWIHLPGPIQSKHMAFYQMSMIEERLLQGGIHGG
jgi:hypothetical protein